MKVGKKEKGVILAGGSGSRLDNLSRITNKHLLPVGTKPMLQWNVEKLVDAGVKDILIITGKDHLGSIVSYFGSGSNFKCKFTYKVQDEAGGIAQALLLVDGFVKKNEFFWVILGDNISNYPLPSLDCFPFVLMTKVVSDPERFGVLVDDDVHGDYIEEKPEDPESKKAVCGIYGYTYTKNFKGYLGSLEKSDRGEVEVTDLNNLILRNEKWITYELDDFEWSDAGTLESYKKVNQWDWVWK